MHMDMSPYRANLQIRGAEGFIYKSAVYTQSQGDPSLKRKNYKVQAIEYRHRHIERQTERESDAT